jgi:hypothetical protein
LYEISFMRRFPNQIAAPAGPVDVRGGGRAQTAGGLSSIDVRRADQLEPGVCASAEVVGGGQRWLCTKPIRGGPRFSP